MPKIETDDLLLFGSLLLTAIGVGLVVISLSGHVPLAIGSTFITFGLPAFAVTFLAAGEPK